MNALRETLIQTVRTDPEKYRKTLQDIPKNIEGIQSNIKAIHLYVIKALGGISIPSAIIDHKGLSTHAIQQKERFRDRMAMLVIKEDITKSGETSHYNRFTQRMEPKLAAAQAALSENNEILYSYNTLNTSGNFSVTPNDLQNISGPEVTFRFGKNDENIYTGVLDVDNITLKIREMLGALTVNQKYNIDDVYLLTPTKNFHRKADNHNRSHNQTETLMSDGGQITEGNIATLNWLNKIAKEKYGENYVPIAMDQFRTNIIHEGFPANIEDLINTVLISGKVKDFEILYNSLSVRCPVTLVNQSNTNYTLGEKIQKGEPLSILQHRPKRTRPYNNSKVTMNANISLAENQKSGLISVGDPIIIQSERQNPHI